MTKPKEKKSEHPPLKRGSGVTHVYETLRNEIIELKLTPGCWMRAAVSCGSIIRPSMTSCRNNMSPNMRT
ncbi:hypothetical protein [Celeribacter neptunius]|uniref:hypothetical protein n=1 Tax=Celeribacter neptunius TaxID=588602 RepID=UPI001160D3F5|nr:hypothetical protein [Celeribacter neptunius]